MYVKLYSKILDSSIASNRNLRHFFIDLLLLADQDGNLMLTKEAIARRTGWEMADVEWGIVELMKPEVGETGYLEHGGRRIEPLEGHGYGWKILNYGRYRDYKSAKELREATAERVKKFREKKKARRSRNGYPGEALAIKADARGEDTGDIADRVNQERGFESVPKDL